MQNRTSDKMAQELRSEITAEKNRHENILQQIKQQFGVERNEWKEAADSLQSLWRIAYLRAIADLEKERGHVFKMKEELRLARLARLQRDYRIGMFQAREMELEDRVAELQEQLEDMNWSFEEEQKKRLVQKEQLRDSVLDLNEIVDERDQLEVRSTAAYVHSITDSNWCLCVRNHCPICDKSILLCSRPQARILHLWSAPPCRPRG